MTTLDLDTLVHVTGGVVSSRASADTTALNQSLATIQSSISSLATNNNGNQSNNLLLPMAMMVAMNRRQSVISANGATVVG